MVGYILLSAQGKPIVSYFGTIFATIGVYPLIAIAFSWAFENAGGTLKQGVVTAIVTAVGNLGGYALRLIVWTFA